MIVNNANNDGDKNNENKALNNENFIGHPSKLKKDSSYLVAVLLKLDRSVQLK